VSDNRPPAFEEGNDPKDVPTIELGKILDLIATKQTQYYALWAVYTAVQFSAANYGMGHKVPYLLAFAILVGFWAFNLGHLGFVLQCVRQLDRLKLLLKIVVTPGKSGYAEALHNFIDNVGEADFFWKPDCPVDASSFQPAIPVLSPVPPPFTATLGHEAMPRPATS
jgi:hypothetical protein